MTGTDESRWREFLSEAYPFEVVEIVSGKGWASQEDYLRDVAGKPLVAYVDCEFRFDEPRIQPGCVLMAGCRLYDSPRFLPNETRLEVFITDCYFGRDLIRGPKYGFTPSDSTP